MKNAAPLISVIIPNYNHEGYLIQRLESVFNQTYSNFEVILLDDKSTDNSTSILSQYSKSDKVSHCIFNEENSGSTFKQWNKGVALAKGEFLWIAETDDFCEIDFLEKVIQPLLENEEVVLSFCQSHRTNSKSVVTGNWITHTSWCLPNPFLEDFIIDGNKFIEHYLIHKNVIPNVSAVLIRKNNLQKIMPLVFKPFMKYNADWFYYIQLVCNAKVAFISESLNYFRYHETSVIAKADGESGMLKIYEMEFQMRAFMLKYLKSSDPDNFLTIQEQYKISNKKLHFEKTNIYLERGYNLKAMIYATRNVLLLKKTIITIFRKIRSGL